MKSKNPADQPLPGFLMYISCVSQQSGLGLFFLSDLFNKEMYPWVGSPVYPIIVHQAFESLTCTGVTQTRINHPG
jgi:hypothetical protein